MKHTRWLCRGCDREWVAAWQWDEKACPAPDCGSPQIERVTFTPQFPGGDYHRMNVEWEPDGRPEPPEIDPKQVHIDFNRTLHLVSGRADRDRDEELALSSPEFE